MILRRRGITLVETCVAMTIGAAMLAVVVGLFYGLLRAERSARDFTRQNSAVNGLADQFRRDAHAALVEGVSGGGGRQFTLAPGHTVTYRVRAGQLVRVEQVGQSVRQQVSPLPPGTTASIDGGSETGPAIVRLAITAASNTNRRPAEQSVQINIDAACCLDHRFDSSGESSHEETDE